MTVGWSHYGRSLTLTTNADGLFMESFWIERLWHPRLFIPWQEFHHATIKDRIWRRMLEVQVGTPSIAALRLSPEIFERSEGRRGSEPAGIWEMSQTDNQEMSIIEYNSSPIIQ